MMCFVAEKDAQDARTALNTKPEPSVAGPVWRGGARERADDVFFAVGIKRRRSKADFAPTMAEVKRFELLRRRSRPTGFRII